MVVIQNLRTGMSAVAKLENQVRTLYGEGTNSPIQGSTSRFLPGKLTIWLDFDKPICYLA
ncbi:hypothetical protein GFPCMMHI_02719 [Ensifer adhaerens]|nr:hypothetical protein [Ensifer adhaerens]